ncbi:MAG: peptidylprolyl isomerase [Flavobacteriales bacterium]|nr:peptidylprolyl isomerase [Flavobacteriales bacterium]|tara:strand:+ start:3961 stop:4635 length:675 start_codon:yes stop_codon:yes gene_type:complete
MKNKLFILGIVVTSVACNQTSYNNVKLNTQMDSVSYSLGISVANNLKSSGFDSIETHAVASAFSDVFEGNEVKINEEDANMLIQDYFVELSQKKSQEAISTGQAFLDENGKKEGVTTTASGLQYEVLTNGTGSTPVETDQVTVHYHGTLVDGTVFDSSIERGQPATFPVNGVIPGWVEALQLMNVGSKYKLYIPSDLAYGERGAGGLIGPNETLIFEVELLSIN